ncbi:hypothetical protein [Dyadobacter sediminis]|uniref:Glycosyltransferase RgtA/B/C/D-like domain-containing protein n=1 Tax=Dyadobacter sediminis TaxID=1493691 RepID=A0A5R9K707_9BACT|nr:hypothetical protein [Dyadobacter sediminis]TLU89564.1 hypothetical protein FEM55_22775 [Dyadobacter sediminis]GGC04275.1 hypothetical protein GCM10011325_34040 [Dyadobacter sediminis]
MNLNKTLLWIKNNSLSISLVFGLISFVILVAIKIKASISYHPDISGSEGSSIAPIQLLVDGNAIYRDPENAPFRLTQYTPLYFCMVAFFCKLANWHAAEVHKIYLASRFFSNVFTILAVSVAGLLIFRITKKKIAGILAALYVFHVLSFWFLTTSRPDSLLVLLTALFICSVYYALSGTGNQYGWYVAIFIAVSAFFVKQSGAILSISLGLFWLCTKQWKTLFTLTVFGLAVFGFYLLLLPINSVDLFFTNIIGGVANSASWGWFYDWTLQHWLLQFAPLIVINIIVSAYILYYKPSDFYLFLTLCCFMFFVFSTTTAFKIGAGVGYYQDYMLTAVVQITLFTCDAANRHIFNNDFLRSGLSLYLVLAFMHCTIFLFMKYNASSNENFVSHYIEERKVSEYLYHDKKLKENEWVYVCPGAGEGSFGGYLLNHFLVRNALIPFADLVYLADRNGTFNYDKFRSMVRKKEIKYVISKKGSVPVNILNYDFGTTLKYNSTIGSFDIYEANKL